MLSVTADPGQAVRKGQVLARLDSAALTDAYNSARAAVTSARNNLSLTQRELGRQRILLAAGAVSQRDVETAQQTVVAAQATHPAGNSHCVRDPGGNPREGPGDVPAPQPRADAAGGRAGGGGAALTQGFVIQCIK